MHERMGHEMRLDVGIEKPANHALVPSMVPCCFGLEDFDRLLAQGQRNFDTLLTKSQIGWRRWKIWDHANLA
jgi:hypothetical protein